MSEPEQEQDNQSNTLNQLDPRSVLPIHLQEITFAKDIWRRLRSHPVTVSALKKDKLDANPETRELLHAVFEVSLEREKDILLHNQARVFQEVMRRLLQGVRDFMNRPMVPQMWVQPTSLSETSSIEQPPEVSDPPENNPSQLNWRKLAGVFLTPKYIVFAIVALFGAATCWTQLENYHLRQAIGSYETANDAAEVAAKQLKETQARNDGLIEDLRHQISTLQNDNRQLGEEKFAAVNRTMKLEEQANSVAIEESELQNELNTLKAKLTDQAALAESVTNSKGEVKSAYEALKTLQENYDELLSTHNELVVKNTNLLNYEQAFGFAETFIDQTRRQLNRYRPDISKIKTALQYYSEAKRRVLNR